MILPIMLLFIYFLNSEQVFCLSIKISVVLYSYQIIRNWMLTFLFYFKSGKMK